MATQEPRTVAFVLYPGITLLDMVGPLQVFSVLQGFIDQYRPVVVAERIEPMSTDTPLMVIADKTFAEVPDPAVVLVPGGGAPTIKAMGDPVIGDYLRRVAGTSQLVGSVCTGAMILAAAGLLEGRNATTHWSHHRLLERLGATYLPDRWVEDGKVITSAGVSAGIDLALALVARLTDEPTARPVGQLRLDPLGHHRLGHVPVDLGPVDPAEGGMGVVLDPQLDYPGPSGQADRLSRPTTHPTPRQPESGSTGAGLRELQGA
jgi:transcriptional regulator GlxA family with amidase domain